MATFVLGEFAITGKRLENTGGERSIDTLKQFQEEHANGIALGGETVTTRVRQFFYQTFGAQLGKIIAERSQRVLGGGQAQSVQGWRVEIGSGETGAGSNVGKAYQSMHQGQLPGVVEF